MTEVHTARFKTDCKGCGKEIARSLRTKNQVGIWQQCSTCGSINWCPHEQGYVGLEDMQEEEA